MRTKVCLLLCSALAIACGDDSTAPVTRLDSGIDAAINSSGRPEARATDELDAAVDDCDRKWLCHDGVREQVDGLCIRTFYGWTDREQNETRYYVCVVDPNGNLYTWDVLGNALVTSPGWTHSAWGSGLVRSNLSATDEARCTAAYQVRTVDGNSATCTR